MCKFGIKNYWNFLLKKYFSSIDVDTYFIEEYVKLYEKEDEKAVCFYYVKDEFCFIFPFLKREFIVNGEKYYDFETAYGYGGPLWNIEDRIKIIEALDCLKELCIKQKYVAGFVRFHPMVNNQIYFDRIATVLPERKTIDIELKDSIENIWMHEIHTKNRNVIKKGLKTGLKFHLDNNFEHLDDFIEIYNTTMGKLQAEDFYYFDRLYYNKFASSVPGAFLAYVTLEKKIIASALFFHSKSFGHYHLAGSNIEYHKYSPNNFLLWNVAIEMKNRGIKRFHLGGGTNSDEKNSLYAFKSRFSKHQNQFYIGKLIFNQIIYSQLCKDYEEKSPQKAELFKHRLLKYKY